jgi:hypothetical protein
MDVRAFAFTFSRKEKVQKKSGRPRLLTVIPQMLAEKEDKSIRRTRTAQPPRPIFIFQPKSPSSSSSHPTN